MSLWLLVAGCCHVARSPRRSAELAAEEQARLARLPADRRPLDVRWDELRIGAKVEDGVAVGSVTLRAPKVRLFSYGGAGEPQIPDLQAALRKLAPVDVNDVDVYDGQVVVADLAEKTKPELWIHDLEVTIENIGTRRALQDHEPILLTARGAVQRSATLVAFITVDPWGSGLDFAGRVKMTGLRSEELYGFLKPTAGVRAPEGVIDLYIAFEAARGKVRGGVKPVVRNLELRSTGGAWSCFKAKVGDFFLSLVGRGPADRVATVVPIEGQLEGPAVEVWPTVLGILYDGFSQGIAAGFGGVPPATAAPKQGAASQTARVVVGGKRPLAQPRGGQAPQR